MPVRRGGYPGPAQKRPLSLGTGIACGCIGMYVLCGIVTAFVPFPGGGGGGGPPQGGLEEGWRRVSTKKAGGSPSLRLAPEPKPLPEPLPEPQPLPPPATKPPEAAVPPAVEEPPPVPKMTDAEVLERISYWKRPKLTRPLTESFPAHPDKYVTMEIDLGGFNNVRMGFEAVILAAMVLGRTYVIPPPCPWYLINWGPIKRAESQGGLGGVSSVSDFFDMEDLAKVIPVITTEEFIAKHQPGSSVDLLELPANITASNKQCKYPIAKLFREEPEGVALAGVELNLLNHVVHWPSIAAVENSTNKPPKRFIAARKRSEVSQAMHDSTVLHFAMNHEKDHRYLGQVAAMFAFEDLQHQREVFRALRDGFHFKHQVFEVASKVVARLGMEGYAAFHVRRNDLQYKESYVPASKSLDAAGELVMPREPIYLSTDEMDPHFFDDWEARGHKVWRYQDFFEDKGGRVLEGIEGAKDPKIIGLIEQVICACARIFFQTPNSTFSSYITRLRGHIDVSNHHVYYHTKGPYKAHSIGERGLGIDNNFYVEYPEVFELDSRRRLLALEEALKE